MQYLPPLDDDENDSIQFLKQHIPSWNPKINEIRKLLDSIRKKETSIIYVTSNNHKIIGRDKRV